MGYTKQLQQAFSTRPSFTIAEVKRLYPKASPAYVSLMLHNLWKEGKIYRISRGAYSCSDDPTVAGFAFRPFYLGLQDAMSIHGIWEQETNPVVITPRKVRGGLRRYAGGNYVVRRICRKLFFGYETIKYSGFFVPVSTIEKTFIDMVHYRQFIPDDALTEFRKRIKKKELNGLLKRCPNGLRKKVLAALKK